MLTRFESAHFVLQLVLECQSSEAWERLAEGAQAGGCQLAFVPEAFMEETLISLAAALIGALVLIVVFNLYIAF